jgi:hypothetical protein
MFYRIQFKCLSLLAMSLLASAVAAQSLPAGQAGSVVKASQSGQALKLNGKGVRTDANGPLYAASLYLSTAASSAEAAVAQSGSRFIQVRMLRPVSSMQMGDLLASGLVANNSEDALLKLVSEVFELGKLIGGRKQLKVGEGFDIEWTADNQTRVTVVQGTGKRYTRQTFTNPDLAAPMLRIWLGATPADPRLQQALLGQAV